MARLPGVRRRRADRVATCDLESVAVDELPILPSKAVSAIENSNQEEWSIALHLNPITRSIARDCLRYQTLGSGHFVAIFPPIQAFLPSGR